VAKLTFTKKEIEIIKSKIYLTNEEEKVLDLWLKESTIVETAMKLNMSESTINRKRKSIINKIKRVI
jgi:DNA-binding CsgD family transcriptional regulator